MASTPLTQGQVKGAKPKDKPYKLTDTNRLYLLVTTAGGKYWKWNFRLDGKDTTYTIGSFPEVGLAEARERRISLSKLVEQGIHPGEHDKAVLEQAKAEKFSTFWSNADVWIQANRNKWSARYRAQIETSLERYAGPDTSFGQRPIKQITAPEVAKLLSGIAVRVVRTGVERKSTGAPNVALLVRQWCGAVFRYAIAMGHADRNPVADLKASDVIVRPKVKNNRALNQTELADVVSSIRSFSGHRQTAIAMELLMRTFVRTAELRGAVFGEIDWKTGDWTIPASRMKIKNAGDHVVPLSSQCVKLLCELKEINGAVTDGPDWLFPNLRDSQRCMSATTINRALERMGFNGKESIGFSAHGFRGTASTLLHEQGERPEVIEVQLAHQERNSVKAAYNKAKYLADRRLMMQKWSDYIDGLLKSKNSTEG